jgi:hypothetical protein
MRKLLVFLITLASIAFAECSLSSAQFAGAVALEHQDLRRLKPLAAAAVYVQHSTATPTASSTASGGFGNQFGAQAPAASITVPASGFGISGFVAGCGFSTSEARCVDKYHVLCWRHQQLVIFDRLRHLDRAYSDGWRRMAGNSDWIAKLRLRSPATSAHLR